MLLVETQLAPSPGLSESSSGDLLARGSALLPRILPFLAAFGARPAGAAGVPEEEAGLSRRLSTATRLI
jgi:hypothetical protein